MSCWRELTQAEYAPYLEGKKTKSSQTKESRGFFKPDSQLKGGAVGGNRLRIFPACFSAAGFWTVCLSHNLPPTSVMMRALG